MLRKTKILILFLVGVSSAIWVLAEPASSATVVDRFEVKLPLGIPAELWSYFVPKDNPITAAKVELGKQLFFDKRLSADASVSCSTCHDPKFAFTDAKRVSDGINGRRGSRNSPSLLNAMFNSAQFWDGRAETLEAQATQPLTNPDEMGNDNLVQVIERLQQIPEYVSRFQAIFQSSVTADGVAKAIAAYERTLIAGNSPFDRFQAGDKDSMSDAAKRGMLLYRTKARCNVCHNLNLSFPFMTDNSYRNTGIAANDKQFPKLMQQAVKTMQKVSSIATLRWLMGQEGGAELGRFRFTGNSLDIGAFRTPSLRNVELTAPYFHDGSASTLDEVVRYYLKGGNENALRDWELQALELTAEEQKDLIEFLKSLTSDDAKASYDARPARNPEESLRSRGQQ